MHKKSNIEIKNTSSDDNEDNFDDSDNMNIMKKEECNDNNHENNCKPIFLDNLIINNNIQLIEIYNYQKYLYNKFEFILFSLC